MRRSASFVLALIVAMAGFVTTALAQNFPIKPIHLIIPWAAGGGTDVLARYLADGLRETLGTPVVVENKPGAGGGIGAAFVGQASPDGYTLLLADLSFVTAPLISEVHHDPIGGFTPVIQLTSQFYLLVIPTASPAQTLQKFIEIARKSDISCATSGLGTAAHLALQLLKQTAGFEAAVIHYTGTAPETLSVATGETQCGFSTPLFAPPLVKAGKVRVLATTSAERLAWLPDVPTVAELGYPGFMVSGWKGVVAPKGTPPEIVGKLHDALVTVLNKPEVQKAEKAEFSEIVASTPQEFGALLASESEKWKKVIAASNIHQ